MYITALQFENYFKLPVSRVTQTIWSKSDIIISTIVYSRQRIHLKLFLSFIKPSISILEWLPGEIVFCVCYVEA